MESDISDIAIDHKGVTISYRIMENDWSFEINGREESAQSLIEAKDMIDKAPPKSKRDFKSFNAWFVSYACVPYEVTVTSIAERSRFRNDPRVWVKHDTTRSKEKCDSICPRSPLNDDIVSKIKNLQNEIDILSEKKESLLKSMVRMPIPED